MGIKKHLQPRLLRFKTRHYLVELKSYFGTENAIKRSFPTVGKQVQNGCRQVTRQYVS